MFREAEVEELEEGETGEKLPEGIDEPLKDGGKGRFMTGSVMEKKDKARQAALAGFPVHSPRSNEVLQTACCRTLPNFRFRLHQTRIL